MNKILLDSAPEDLRQINREKLEQMGVRESVIKEFLHHPKYSPRHETILVHALAEMKGVKNRDQFIKQALHISILCVIIYEVLRLYKCSN